MHDVAGDVLDVLGELYLQAARGQHVNRGGSPVLDDQCGLVCFGNHARKAVEVLQEVALGRAHGELHLGLFGDSAEELHIAEKESSDVFIENFIKHRACCSVDNN